MILRDPLAIFGRRVVSNFCVSGGAQDVNAQDGSLRRRASNAVCAALLPVGLGDPRNFIWGPNLAPRL